VRLMGAPRAARSVSQGRTYTINGLTLWSVTTIIGNGLPKPAIAGWQAKSIAEFAVANWRQIGGMLGAVRLMRTQDSGSFIISDPDAVDGAVDWLKGAPWRESKRKMSVGSAVHAEAEAYALGTPRPEPLPAVAPYLISFRNFLEDFKPDFELVEATVFNVTEGYAGTLDAVAKVGGRRFLFDWKTGKDIYPDVALQLAAYEHAEGVLLRDGTTAPMPTVDGCCALHLTEHDPELAALDPTYRGYYVVPVATGKPAFDAFLYVREVMRWMEETSKGVLSQPVTNPAALVALYPETITPTPEKAPKKRAAA
jgi:hypothetical protein